MSAKHEDVRELLKTAAGPDAAQGEGWHSVGMRRLHFQNDKDINASGLVEVHEEEGKDPQYVRVELFVSPEIAAEVISHITGMSDLTAKVLARQHVHAALAEQKTEPEKVHGDGMDLPVSVAKLEAEDDARSAELDEIIARTGGLMAPDEDEAAPESKTEPEETELARLVLEQATDDTDEMAEVA